MPVTDASLSFYKETLAGETDNYVHMRAKAEGKVPIAVLRELVDEVLDSVRTIEQLASVQPGLTDICHAFVMVSVICCVRYSPKNAHEDGT